MIQWLLLFFLLFSGTAFAGGDEIQMKDGSSMKGDIIGQNPEQVYLSTKDKGVVRIKFSDITTINYGPNGPVNPPKPKDVKTVNP